VTPNHQLYRRDNTHHLFRRSKVVEPVGQTEIPRTYCISLRVGA